MPCDQRITTSAVELTKVDRKRLAAVLTELGWRVSEHQGVLSAYRGALSLRVTDRDARLDTDRYGASPEEVLTGIRVAYAERTVKDVSRRFGFKAAGAQTLNNGAKRLVLRR